MISKFGYVAERHTRDGATLQELWDEGEALAMLSSRAYDIVVLQEDVPELQAKMGIFPKAQAAFQAAADLFITSIRDTGATPVLFAAVSNAAAVRGTASRDSMRPCHGSGRACDGREPT